MLQLSNRLEYTQILLKGELVCKREKALDQLKDGLNALEFLSKARSIATFNYILEKCSSATTTAEYLRERLLPNIEALHPESESETRAKQFSKDCLKDLTGMSPVS